MNRTEILTAAADYVTRDRAATHGDAERNFDLVGLYWSMHLGCLVKASDVAVMMAMLKLARIKANPANIDSYVDAAGYAALAGEIACKGCLNG